MERKDIMDLGSGEPKEIMGLGSGEPKEIMDLVSGKPMETIALGSGEPKEIMDLVSGELEDYPFVRRLRNRRLLVYLWLQGFDTAYDSVVHESGVQMSRLHLRQLVVWGRWSESLNYITCFLPTALIDRSLDARSLLFFLHMLWALANVAACSMGGLVNDDSVHSDLSFLRSLSSINAKLYSILRYTLHSPQFRTSLDWMLVRKKASLIVDDWALETPELRRKLQLPGGPGLPQDLLPIGPLCPRRHRRERSQRAKACTIAKSYLNRKRSLLPPPSPHPEGLPEDALTRVVDLIDKGCLRAGKLPELHEGCPLQSNAKEGASGTPLLQTKLGTVTNPAKNTGASSVNAGAAVSLPIKIPWITSATDAGSFKHSGKDGWYSNQSAGQGSVERKKRENLMTAEDDPDRKRQRTELELVTEVEAGSCSANLMAN